jgi:hypothetical protein
VIYASPDSEPIPPIMLSKTDGQSEVFLTAQAESPIEGDSWGLLLQYNCSIVEKVSDLTILKPRDRSNTADSTSSPMTPIFADPSGNTRVAVANQTFGYRRNLFGVVEYGYSKWPNTAMQNQLSELDSFWAQKKATGCYYNQYQNVTGDYHDVDQESIFEMILWQSLITPRFYDPVPNYDGHLGNNLTELYGGYSMRLEKDFTYTPIQGRMGNQSYPMSAVGVRCSSSSSVGTAQVDGARSRFTNFVRTDTPINNGTQRCATRFNAESISKIFDQSFSIFGQSFSNGQRTDWINDLFSSVSGETEYYAKLASDLELDNIVGDLIRLSYFQASDLRTSVLRAYAAYAINLMYSNGQGFIASDGVGGSLRNPNVTGFATGTVIKPGIIPMEVPMVMFFIWTLVAVGLCITYGFRLRWSDTVDEGIRTFRR